MIFPGRSSSFFFHTFLQIFKSKVSPPGLCNFLCCFCGNVGDWNLLITHCSALSLFASKVLTELSISPGIKQESMVLSLAAFLMGVGELKPQPSCLLFIYLQWFLCSPGYKISNPDFFPPAHCSLNWMTYKDEYLAVLVSLQEEMFLLASSIYASLIWVILLIVWHLVHCI